ncbi:GDSL-type esterase/lipase family protein [Thalassobellus suaedae]|uniref:GDSL-type esterase/lipase family protein n=1 Tax=Thalassobellus suaedae TaxID=3074124 RepID=A0ABY9Y2A5_9FLAO|nr:GDSL-type esterase/lipase family protein [Flavobacteriaceae bacterium HL-DH10]
MKIIKLILLFLITTNTLFAQIKVSCVGNSITEGWNGNPSYVPILQKLLGANYIVKNNGKSGATILNKGNKPYCKQEAFLRALNDNADIITILLGTNDTKSQNWDKYSSDFKSDYVALIDTLQSTNRNAKIFLVIPVPACRGNFGIRNDILNLEIPIIKQIAKEKGLPIIDANTPLLESCNYFNDGVHPNAEGANAIALLLYQSITK